MLFSIINVMNYFVFVYNIPGTEKDTPLSRSDTPRKQAGREGEGTGLSRISHRI